MTTRKDLTGDESFFENLLHTALPNSSVRMWQSVPWPPALTLLARRAFQARYSTVPDLGEKQDAFEALGLSAYPLLIEWLHTAPQSELYPAILAWALYGQYFIHSDAHRPGRDETNAHLANRSTRENLLQEITSTERQVLILEALQKNSGKDRNIINAEKNRGIRLWYRRIENHYQTLVEKQTNTIPQLPVIYLTRQEWMTRLGTAVQRSKDGLLFVTGPAGAGKATLLAAWARQQAAELNFPDGIYWFSDVNFAQFESKAKEKFKTRDAVELRTWLQQKRALLILVGPTDEQVVNWLSGLSHLTAKVIVVLNFEAWSKRHALDASALNMTQLEPSERRSFVTIYMKDRPIAESEWPIVEEVGELLNWLPLAMAILSHQAAATSWTDVLTALKARSVQPTAIHDNLGNHFNQLLDLTYKQMLPEDQVDWLRLTALGLVSSFDRTAICFILGCDQIRAQYILELLVSAHLLDRIQSVTGSQPRYRFHFLVWQYMMHLVQTTHQDIPSIQYRDYAGLLHNPRVWWKPTMPASGGKWHQAFLDLRLWWYPETIIQPNNFLGRIFMRQYKLLQEYLLKKSRLLTFEELATLQALAQSSNKLMSWQHNCGLLVWLSCWIPVILAAGLWLTIPFNGIIGIGAFLILFLALVYEYPFFVHQLNYYQLIWRIMGPPDRQIDK